MQYTARMTHIVGIVNCTPDSFSDGSDSASPTVFIERAERLVDEGADILDLGGDSTRPGSECAGVEEEWRRIAPVLTKMSSRISCSVDTHHPEVARRAIANGASYINDISGALTQEMLTTIAESGVFYIAMFNPNRSAHRFGGNLTLESTMDTITPWVVHAIALMKAHGIAEDKIVIDPGMGAFVSPDPSVSWEILNRCHELPLSAGGLFIGCSRKGFLALPGESSILDRDARTASVGREIATRLKSIAPLYLRVHNVAAQRRALAAM